MGPSPTRLTCPASVLDGTADYGSARRGSIPRQDIGLEHGLVVSGCLPDKEKVLVRFQVLQLAGVTQLAACQISNLVVEGSTPSIRLWR